MTSEPVELRSLELAITALDCSAGMSCYFPAVEAEGGVVEKFIGDAAVAAFGLYAPGRTTPRGPSGPLW